MLVFHSPVGIFRSGIRDSVSKLTQLVGVCGVCNRLCTSLGERFVMLLKVIYVAGFRGEMTPISISDTAGPPTARYPVAGTAVPSDVT